MRGGWYEVTGDSGKALASRLGMPIEPAKGLFCTSGQVEPARWCFRDRVPTSEQQLGRLHAQASQVGNIRARIMHRHVHRTGNASYGLSEEEGTP